MTPLPAHALLEPSGKCPCQGDEPATLERDPARLETRLRRIDSRLDLLPGLRRRGTKPLIQPPPPLPLFQP